jgi:hypothetical protein
MLTEALAPSKGAQNVPLEKEKCPVSFHPKQRQQIVVEESI